MTARDSGPDLIREALEAAEDSEARAAVQEAAATVIREMTTLLHGHWEAQGGMPSRSNPVICAYQRVIRELYAATDGNQLPPQNAESLGPSEQAEGAVELEAARWRSAKLVHQCLGPRPSSVRRRLSSSPGEYSLSGEPLRVEVCPPLSSAAPGR